MLELFERFPRLADLPRHPLGDFPTPVVEARPLAAKAGVESVFVKCDNVTGELYGGNKVRKLEFLLGDALSRQAGGVWTVGAIGSHHCLATALYATRAGLEVTVRHFPQPVSEHVRKNCLAVAATGARLRLGRKGTLPLSVGYQVVKSKLRRGPGSIYYIPGGGSSPIAVLGYVNAALEIAAQVESDELPRLDAVFVPVGTAGTLAGLVLGFRLASMRVDLVGVRVVDHVLVNRFSVNRLVRRTARLLRAHGVDAGGRARKADYRLDHRQFGPGYGSPTEQSLAAVELARQACDIQLEHTYTGKAMASVLAAGKGGGAPKRVLFLNTFNSRPVEPLIPDGFGWDRLPRGYARFFEGEPEV